VAQEEVKCVCSIAGRGLIISEMEFLGVTAVPLVDLQLASIPLMRQEYSALQISRFIDLQLKPVFREQGYLQVDFEPPVGKLVKAEEYGQQNPVQVTLNVSEGRQYRWAGAEWSGNTRLYKPALDRLLGMKMDAVANGTKLDSGLKSILEEYGKFGLMEVELTPEPEFIEEESRVLYRIVIKEGRQYRMGRLEFRGFTETDIQELTDRWRIKPGEIYDSSYLSEFLENEIPAIVTSRRKLQLESKTKTDNNKLLVNVQISAKGG
jgi:outer membrane protein assembly factor BamA